MKRPERQSKKHPQFDIRHLDDGTMMIYYPKQDAAVFIRTIRPLVTVLIEATAVNELSKYGK